MIDAELIAYRACILLGNHNNIPLIDRQVYIAEEKLWANQIWLSGKIAAIVADVRTVLREEEKARQSRGFER